MFLVGFTAFRDSGTLQVGIRAWSNLGRTQSPKQKEMDKRGEKTEREISSLREWMIEVSRGMNQLNGTVKELTIDKDKSGSAITGVLQKGKNVAERGEGESS